MKIQIQNIAGCCQQTFEHKKCNVLPLRLQTFPAHEFSLKVKVEGLNPGYLIKSSLLYLVLVCIPGPHVTEHPLNADHSVQAEIRSFQGFNSFLSMNTVFP